MSAGIVIITAASRVNAFAPASRTKGASVVIMVKLTPHQFLNFLNLIFKDTVYQSCLAYVPLTYLLSIFVHI